MLILGCGDLALLSGIFAAVVGGASLYHATATGAGAFLATLLVSLGIMVFVIKGDSS
ncbi:hypothetical protein ACFWMV_04710 [Streptomyces mutabilis]|uniref:hypothetical protein n=1 Tax=Streptomyces mutabilis TaxID=67332 RepID=UPI003647AE02